MMDLMMCVVAALVTDQRRALFSLLVLAVPLLIVWACIAIFQSEKRGSRMSLEMALLILVGASLVFIGIVYAGCSLTSLH